MKKTKYYSVLLGVKGASRTQYLGGAFQTNRPSLQFGGPFLRGPPFKLGFPIFNEGAPLMNSAGPIRQRDTLFNLGPLPERLEIGWL